MIDIQMSCQDDLSLCPIFGDMSRPERNELLTYMETEHFRVGHTLLREGDVCRGLHVLIAGSCEVVKEVGGGGEQQLAVLQSGAIFGEVSFFSQNPHSATIRAVTGGESLLLPYQEFESLRRDNPGLAMKLILNMGRLLSERFRRMDHYTYDLFASRSQRAEPTDDLVQLRHSLYHK